MLSSTCLTQPNSVAQKLILDELPQGYVRLEARNLLKSDFMWKGHAEDPIE